MENQENSKVGIISLVGLVIGSIIGSGAFSFPGDMAKGASAGAIIIAWIITGVGMLTLGFVFQNLSNRRADLNCGIYSYDKDGFGDNAGFNCAWGHWISSTLGNITKETYTAKENNKRTRDMIISSLALIFAIWLIYAAGLSYMLLLSILFSVGIIVFYKAKKEQNAITFTKVEKIAAAILFGLGVITVFTIFSGMIKI